MTDAAAQGRPPQPTLDSRVHVRPFTIVTAVLKVLYSVLAGVFCVWIASFAPVEGPSLLPFIPARAAIMLHFRDGAKEDRKSTRLNSSHPSISYAVFCLKKKKQKNIQRHDLIKDII